MIDRLEEVQNKANEVCTTDQLIECMNEFQAVMKQHAKERLEIESRVIAIYERAIERATSERPC